MLKLINLRRERLRARLTQRDLAKKADVSPTTVAQLENGHLARFATIKALAEALGVEETVLTGEGDE